MRPPRVSALNQVKAFLELCSFNGAVVSYPMDEWREAATPENLLELVEQVENERKAALAAGIRIAQLEAGINAALTMLRTGPPEYDASDVQQILEEALK